MENKCRCGFITLPGQLVEEMLYSGSVPRSVTENELVIAGMLKPGNLGERWILGDRSQVHQDGAYVIPGHFGLRDCLSVSSQGEYTPESEEFPAHSVGMGREELMRHHVVYFLVRNSDGLTFIRIIPRALLV